MSDTYGTLTRGKDGWEIKTAPHVLIRLKRVFERISKGQFGTVTLADTPENCRELLWFMERFPFEMDLATEARLRVRTLIHLDREAAVRAILKPGYVAPPVKLALPLREYQAQAVALVMANGALLLGDDVGTGKTASAIGVIADVRARPALVVTLTHLPLQWEAEIKRFAPDLKVHILKSGKPYDLTKRRGKDVAFPDVIISNYHKLSGWGDVLGERVKSVVFDETQELRTGQSAAKWSAAKYIAGKADYRLQLSATPIFNYGAEIYNVLSVIFPDALGSFDEFIREWCRGNEFNVSKSQIKEPRAFGMYLRDQGLMLRRTRADIGRELPPVSTIPHVIEADLDVFSKIESSAVELARVLLTQGGQAKGAKLRAAEELSWMLRQATGVAKCLAPGTQIIKADGSIEVVENLKVGDCLLGPDSKPRKVLGVIRGHGEMFEVRSTARSPLFDPYVVNGDHILALKHSGAVRHGDRNLFGPYMVADHIEVSVSEYIGKSAHFKRLLKSYKTGVEFPEQLVPLDPYFLGLWLGDGSSDAVAVTTEDVAIKEYLYEFAASYGLKVRVKQPERAAPTYYISPGIRGGLLSERSTRNPIHKALRDLGVLGNKHIPRVYAVNSRVQRMRLLAGLLDSDGHHNCPGVYTLVSKWGHLAAEIKWLAQSLGLAAKATPITARDQHGNRFPAHRVSIYGNGLEHLPLRVPHKQTTPRRQRKDPLRSGIKVIPVGPGPYCGFTLDGDGLFLLRDFTVTHNSAYVADFVRLLIEQGEAVVLFGWHRIVYDMWKERLADLKPVFYTGEESTAEKEAAKAAFVKGETKLMVVSLRSGAGLDGLQHVCRTVVFGELDWSPAVLEQCIGRVARDGQLEKVAAYVLLSTSGSDPVVADVLGLKKMQLTGICDPNAPTAAPLQGSDVDMKKLAAEFLRQRGVVLALEPASEPMVTSFDAAAFVE